MAIKTDSTPLPQPKNPDSCPIFGLYSALANSTQADDLRKKYLAGGYGYGQAKETLWELILTQFAEERQCFRDYKEDRASVEKLLNEGAAKANHEAKKTLQRVRGKLGYA